MENLEVKNNSLEVKDEFNDIYIEKCKDARDCEKKLKELILLSGLDIDFDIDNEEAYLNLPHRRVKMEKGNGDIYYFKQGRKFIGFEFKGTWGCLDFGIELKVFMRKGINFRSYQYKQSYFNNGSPWFYYNDYIDGVAHEFACNGHIAHFRDSNSFMCDTQGILNEWGIKVKNKKKGLNYHEFAFGGTEKQINSKTRFIHIPTALSININNGICEEKSIGVGTFAYLCERKCRYYYKGENRGVMVPSYEAEDNIEPENYKSFEIEDPELMENCVRILRHPCNKIIFRVNKEYLSNLPVYKYISKYYSILINGIEYYQNLGSYENNEDIAKSLGLRENQKRISG